MCYCGCGFENRAGGCAKPFGKACPQDVDEMKDKELEILEKELEADRQGGVNE